jgi:tetratricopeptide (TPR) repeat protein
MPAGFSETSRKARVWLFPTGVALLAALVLARVVGHGFLAWDDLVNTVRNPHVNPPSLEGTLFFWRHAYADLYVPATFTIWALLARITFHPWIFHAASVLAHAASAAAAFRLLRRLVASDLAAAAGALLFALHPVQVEPVAWMSGLKDVLCGLFSLLALGAYVDFARASSGEGGKWKSFFAASALFLLALLSKPSAVAVPLLAGSIDVLLLRRRPAQVARDLMPWAALSVAWSLLARSAQPAAGVAVPAFASRFLVAGDSLAFYLGKLVWPAALAPDYGRDPVSVLEGGRAALVALAAAAAALLLLRSNREAPRDLGVALVLFAAGVAPVLGFLPFDFQRYSTVADHYLYLSMIGPGFLLARRLARPARPALLAAGVLLLLLGARSVDQAGEWRDDETLWRHTLAVNRRSWLAHDNLGQALESKGRRSEAIAEYEQAIALHPGDARTQFNLGAALDALDRTAEALPHLEAAVRLQPEDRVSRENLGIALLRLERPAEAEPHLRKAIELEPRSFLAHYYLAGVLDRLGEEDEMLEHLREAVRLNPRFEPARVDLEGVLRARSEPGPR